MRVATIVALACLAFGMSSAGAQTWPAKPIKIIVPQPPGGGYDLIGRVFAERLQPLLGQPVVVENRPGAGTLVGTEAAARAPADGHTLLIAGTSNIALNPGLYAKLPYDPIRDFSAIGLVLSWPYLLVARKDLPHASLRDLVEDARKNPGKITYASAGRGTGQHVASAVMARIANIDLTHVPYSGASPVYQDMMGGRIDIFFDSYATALPQARGGAIRALAVSTAKRDAAMPDTPTLIENGVNYDFDSWVGIFAPAGTPAPVLTRLREEFMKVRARPDVAEIFAKTGAAMRAETIEAAEAFFRVEVERWPRLIREAGVVAE